MKIKTIILIGTLSTLFLAGCQETNPTEKADTPSNVMVNVSEDQAKVAPDKATEESGSEADQSAYIGAIKLLDISFCAKINDSDLKKQCETDVKNATYKKDAIDQLSPELCEKLSNDDIKESCKTEIEVQKELKNNKEKELSDVNAYNSIIENAEYEKCSTLSTPDLVELCENNKIIYEAISKKDITLCEKLPNNNAIEECKKSYEANSSN